MTYTDEEVLGTTVQLLAELSTRNNENVRLKTINADLLAALQDMVAWYPDNPHHPLEARAARWRAQDAIKKATNGEA